MKVDARAVRCVLLELPAGLVLYFATSNLFRIGQQATIFALDDRHAAARVKPALPAGGDPRHRARAAAGAGAEHQQEAQTAQEEVAHGVGGSIRVRPSLSPSRRRSPSWGSQTPNAASVEVLQEPKPGFLGMGKQPAVVKVSVKPHREVRWSSAEPGDRDEATGATARTDAGAVPTAGATAVAAEAAVGARIGNETRRVDQPAMIPGSRNAGQRVAMAARVSARSRRWTHRRSTRH